jgi:hypothetical protein
MGLSLLYVSALLVSPTIAFILNGWIAGVFTLLSSVLVARVTKNRSSATRRMMMLTLLVNQIVISHSLYRSKPESVPGPDITSLTSFDGESKPVPFVSIVLVPSASGSASIAIEALKANSSRVLAKEIVVPQSLVIDRSGDIPIVTEVSDSSEFVVYVSTSAVVPKDWLNGLVREFIANDTRLVVPVVTIESGSPQAAFMLGSKTGALSPLWFTEASGQDVPVIKDLSLLGIPKKVLQASPETDQLVHEGRMMELSLRAWLCQSGIMFTRFTTVTLEHTADVDWKLKEGEDVFQSIRNCPRNREWFFSKFKQYDPDSESERALIQSDDWCLATRRNKLNAVTPCDRTNSTQIFELKDGSVRATGAAPMCLDAASTSKPGKSPILYTCMHGNRNQAFQFIAGRLMWGSFCVERHEDGRVTLEYCMGLGDQIKPSQRWIKTLVS